MSAPTRPSPPSPPSLTRRGVLGLAGAAALPLLAGCGAGAPKDETSAADTENGKSGGTFTVYWNAGHVYETYNKVIADFEKAHGLEVQLQKFQWPDMRTRLLADFASGNVPDVVEEPGGWVQEFAVTGDARSLQEYVDKDGEAMGFPSDWQDNTIERNSYENEVYGIQLHLTCMLLFYNKGMFDAEGLSAPKTWDDVLTAAKALTKGKVHGIALNQDSGYAWPWLAQNGVRSYDPTSKEILTPRDAAIEALQFQADLVHEHKVSPVPTPGTTYSGPQKLFSAKRAAMIVTGPWDLQPIAQTSPDIELGLAGPLRGKVEATSQAGTSVFVPAKAKRPDLSWDFIKRITTLEVELAATKEAGMLMPRKSWAQNPAVQNDEMTKPFADAFAVALDTTQDLRLTGKSGEVGEHFKTMYQSIVMQNKPAAEAVQAYVEAARKVLTG
ncbi:MAG TPA: sugar ABC transporter substrate-binding protein, partial [Actinopolymorphaceae bacterium]